MLEFLSYGIGVVGVIFISFGLFGGFDDDEDNPFRNTTQ